MRSHHFMYKIEVALADWLKENQDTVVVIHPMMCMYHNGNLVSNYGVLYVHSEVESQSRFG